MRASLSVLPWMTLIAILRKSLDSNVILIHTQNCTWQHSPTV